MKFILGKKMGSTATQDEHHLMNGRTRVERDTHSFSFSPSTPCQSQLFFRGGEKGKVDN